ncbi:DNA alkylation repair protein [Myxococcota bacterium]|nr:DNA alkylation repair protein [Myxococcota bacterium]
MAKRSSKLITAWVDAITAEFEGAGDPARAEKEKVYLKSPRAFHGVTVPFVRAAAKRFRAEHTDLGREELRALVDALFATPFHDLRSFGIALLELERARLVSADLEWVEALLRASSTWDHVDWLSVHVAGWLVERDPVLRDRLSAWSRDEHMWLRRASVLSLLEPLRAGGGDFALFERLAVPLLGEKDFFIRKVVGWVLRDVSRKRPALTAGFVERHRAACSALTLREASKHLAAAPAKAPRAKVSRVKAPGGGRAGSRSPRASR